MVITNWVVCHGSHVSPSQSLYAFIYWRHPSIQTGYHLLQMLVQASSEMEASSLLMSKLAQAEKMYKQELEAPNLRERPLAMIAKEKQISVDPVSVKQVERVEKGDYWSLASPLTTPRSSTISRGCPPLLLPPIKSKFVSASLPNSATSSPRSGSALMKNLKKWRNQNQATNTSHAISSLARQRSATVSPFASQESHLRRSKSCGEGRASAPADDFDLWSSKGSMSKQEHEDNNDTSYKYEGYQATRKNIQGLEPCDDSVKKCGALCLFLPAFGKGKPVRSRKEEEEEEVENTVVSRTVSMEKFECASWASSARLDENGESMRLYFDLPLELIQNSVNDAHSPVATAFVFERDPKGVLKKSTSRGSAAGKQQDSSRHVRFSQSSCISPRLRKAREDFNAFLEAQGA